MILAVSLKDGGQHNDLLRGKALGISLCLHGLIAGVSDLFQGAALKAGHALKFGHELLDGLVVMIAVDVLGREPANRNPTAAANEPQQKNKEYGK